MNDPLLNGSGGDLYAGELGLDQQVRLRQNGCREAQCPGLLRAGDHGSSPNRGRCYFVVSPMDHTP